ATATGADERNRHAVAHLPAGHPVADRLHHPGQFVARNVRKTDAVIVPHPTVPVTAAQAGRPHTDDCTGRRYRRSRHLDEIGHGTELREHDSTHDPKLLVSGCALSLPGPPRP